MKLTRYHCHRGTICKVVLRRFVEICYVKSVAGLPTAPTPTPPPTKQMQEKLRDIEVNRSENIWADIHLNMFTTFRLTGVHPCIRLSGLTDMSPRIGFSRNLHIPKL